MDIYKGDCLEIMRTAPSNSVDSIVTDPPAGISFRNKSWDSDKGGRDAWIAWMTEVMTECLRVLKPGGHALVWAIPRTSHWTATALENAGFEVRDVVTHLFGTGFPKSLDLSKAIDKMEGVEREVIGSRIADDIRGGNLVNQEAKTHVINITIPSTDSAKQWQGWGTALKPASEHWILVRKPISESTVAKNVLKHGVGGLNIDATRIQGQKRTPGYVTQEKSVFNPTSYGMKGHTEVDVSQGRFPANLILDEDAAAALDEQSGDGASRVFFVVKHAKESVCETTNAAIAENTLEIIQEIEKVARTYFAPEAAAQILDLVSLYLNAKSAENFVDSIEIDFVLEAVKIKNKQDLLSSQCLGSMPGYKSFIPLRNLALIAGKTESTVTIQAIQNFLRLCGFALLATDVNTRQGSQKNANVPNRFLYCAKASKSEKNAGLEDREAVKVNDGRQTEIDNPFQRGETQHKNTHPTVKPIKLMEYLIKLITPPGGTVLDPFMGSGSTGVAAQNLGFGFTGIERELEYFEIAKKRVQISCSN